MTTKYLTYERFEDLNKKAVRRELNRSLYFDRLPISEDDVFPISFSLIHNDKEMRCEVVLNAEGETAWLDMSLQDYSGLPEVEAE